MKIKSNTAKYIVYVDDNFHYMDESERYCAGEFDALEEAIAKCKQIVDESLSSSSKNRKKRGDALPLLHNVR